MSDIFEMKRGDTRPGIDVALKQPDGTAYPNLATATAQVLIIRLADGTVLAPKAMTVQDAGAGIVRYLWVDADWDPGGLVAGLHSMEYEITEADGGKITFPTKAFHKLLIYEDLA